MEKTSDEEKRIQAVKALVLNMFINNYAVERVAFGYEKPGDKAPIDLYIDGLRLYFDYEPSMRKDVPGVYIDEQERISAEFDYGEYVYDLFVYQMEKIFSDAPKDESLVREGEDIPLQPRVRDYLFGIFPLFAEILKVEVDNSAPQVTDDKIALYAKEYHLWHKFVTDILLNPPMPGSQINKYVRYITKAPHYIGRLIEERDGRFYLKPVDFNGYEYAFALFSLMTFKDRANGNLLELKMREWERRHKNGVLTSL